MPAFRSSDADPGFPMRWPGPALGPGRRTLTKRPKTDYRASMGSDGAFWGPTPGKGDLKTPWRRRHDGCNRLPFSSFHAAATFTEPASLQGTPDRRAGLPVFPAAAFGSPARDQEGKPSGPTRCSPPCRSPLSGLPWETSARGVFHTPPGREVDTAFLNPPRDIWRARGFCSDGGAKRHLQTDCGVPVWQPAI